MISGEWLINYELINYKLAVHCAIFHSCPDAGRITFLAFHFMSYGLKATNSWLRTTNQKLWTVDCRPMLFP